MPLTPKGKRILRAMQREYGAAKGVLEGVERVKRAHEALRRRGRRA